MLQLILEMLVNGTPPALISPNIDLKIALIRPDVEIRNLPSISFIKEYRTVLCILGEILTSYRLAQSKEWGQLFTNGTSRRQVVLRNLIVSVIDNDEIKPLILSSAIKLEGETSYQQQASILNMISKVGERLKRWEEVISTMFPNYKHDIPMYTNMNISKFDVSGAITTDTCNSARKTRRLLLESIADVSKDLRKQKRYNS